MRTKLRALLLAFAALAMVISAPTRAAASGPTSTPPPDPTWHVVYHCENGPRTDGVLPSCTRRDFYQSGPSDIVVSYVCPAGVSTAAQVYQLIGWTAGADYSYTNRIPAAGVANTAQWISGTFYSDFTNYYQHVYYDTLTVLVGDERCTVRDQWRRWY